MKRLALVVLLFAALQVYGSSASKRAWDLAEPLKGDDNDMTPEPTGATDFEFTPEKEDDKDDDDIKVDDKIKDDDDDEKDEVDTQRTSEDEKTISGKDEIANLAAGEVNQKSEEEESSEYGHGPDIVEGDIKLTPEQAALFKTGGWDALVGTESWIPNNLGKWSRTIPYVIDSGVHSSVRSAISNSIGLFHRSTCLRFVPRRYYNRNYIRFVERGCTSNIGRVTTGEQIVSLSRNCFPAKMLVHTLGRYHESVRPDRDIYVKINWGNILRGFDGIFRIRADADAQSVPYDYDSVTHYGTHAFSSNRQPTIVPLQRGVTIGQRSRLSTYDILQANIRYCPEKAVRLVGGRGTYEGRVEVFWNGQWGTVCDHWFDLNDAHTICKYLGFPRAEAYFHRAHFGRGSGPIWFDDMNCKGNEYGPFSCCKNVIGVHNCRHTEDAGVRCQKNVRLVNNGTSASNGRVEVYLNGRWGTVCDDGFGIEEARVICRQIGLRARAAYGRARYGQGTLPILLDDLQCTGNEAQIGFCRSTPVGEHNCGHHEDASVVCY